MLEYAPFISQSEAAQLSWQWFSGLTAFILLWISLRKSVLKENWKKKTRLVIMGLGFK